MIRPWVRPSELVITTTLALPRGVVVASPDAAAVATLVAESAFFLESKHTLKCLSVVETDNLHALELDWELDWAVAAAP